MEDLGVLYKATDPQGKVYIGQHVGDGSDIGKTYFGSGTYFNRTRKKHGNKYFTYWVFSTGLTKEERNQGEIYYIKFFQARDSQNGYNLTDGGECGALLGHVTTEETKKKITESMLGKNTGPRSEEYKNNMALAWSNKSEEEFAEFSKKQSEVQKIAQNKLETKNKKRETWSNKSEEEKAEIIKKCSDSSIIAQNDPELKNKRAETWDKKSDEEKAKWSEAGSHSNHIRWHKNRNIINPNCKFCVG